LLPPEIILERVLQEKHRRGEQAYAYVLGRVPVEDLSPGHVHRWLVEWMNGQLSNLGVNSTGGRHVPPLHFDLVRVKDKTAAAHVFEADGFAFIIVTEPMVQEMLAISGKLVNQNRALIALQIAPDAEVLDVVHFLVFLQFCFVASHEYSHLVRNHLQIDQPDAAEVGDVLTQTQELDADGYAIYHALEYLFRGDGRRIASTWLNISSPKALDNSILDCFLLSIMVQFCARWAGRVEADSDISETHPPPPVRIEYALLFVDMWCSEVGGMPTRWMTAENLRDYFAAAARLFPVEVKRSWDELVKWLKGRESEEYRLQIRSALNRIRTGSSHLLSEK
jgi:hypothetical protein